MFVERVKMKEEKNKKKCIKKEKNPKCGQDCTGDDGRLVEVKKTKKNKKVDPVVMNTENELGWDGSGENKEKKKRFVTESLNEAQGTEFKNEIEKKVRKKKKRDYDENQAEIAQGSVKEEEKKHRKEKKVKNKSSQIKSENVQIEEEQQVENDKMSKKTNKDKKTLVDTIGATEGQLKKKKKTIINEETSETIDGSIKKKKNKAKMNVSENEAMSEIPEGETDEVKEVKKKKMRKEKRKKEDGNAVDAPQVKNSVFNMKKDDSAENEIATIEEEEMEPKKKKRKKKTSKGEEERPLSLQCEDDEEQKGETLGRVASDAKSKKGKVLKEEAHVDRVTFETSAKKKTKEKMEDKNERRQSDQASPPQHTPMGFGQWSSAQFDSADQQQKFLRLMGGFKKSFQPATGNTGRANMALGKDAQQQLQQGLQGEFERAHSRRLDVSNRGAGFGFAAPCNKKFSIDINACRSVRFDD